MFERMKIVESIYEGGEPSKNTQQVESKRASLDRGGKGEASTLTYNPETGRAGKRKRKNTGHPSDVPNGAKKTCMLYGPGHSLEEWKILK